MQEGHYHAAMVFLRVYTKTSWHQYEDLPSWEVIHGKTLPNASPLLKSTRFPCKYPKIGIFTLVYCSSYNLQTMQRLILA